MISKKIVCLSFLIGVAGFSFAQSQTEMNLEAADTLKKSLNKLEETITRIKVLYKSQPEFLKEFDDAQLAWTKFKDAELKIKFPEDRDIYGSVYPMCVAYYVNSIVKERIKKLQEWIVGIEEGDACRGSVRFKTN